MISVSVRVMVRFSVRVLQSF